MKLIHHSDGEGQAPITQAEAHSPLLHFSMIWDMLGPFQIGTREASWGADPLEYLGGFRSLQWDPKSAFPSSLAPFGQVHWSRQQAVVIQEHPNEVEIALNIQFPDVNWQWLQQIYGWATLQYQAWTRGKLIIKGNKSETVVLYTDGILEYWLDGKHYFGGDYYAYRRAPPVFFLQPGAHTVDLRVVRDVRLLGAMSSSMSIVLRAETSEGQLKVPENQMLISDVINGVLASPYASIPIRNDGRQWLTIQRIEAASENCSVKTFRKSYICRLAPGQSRRLPFNIRVSQLSDPTISVKILYFINEAPTRVFNIISSHVLVIRDVHDPHKMTYLHPGHIVSYTILRAPSRKAISAIDPAEYLPIHLNLHGAGLESDSDQVRHMLDEVPDLQAFLLFPTGVTPWSGDDWHEWGFADVKAAIASIADWIQQVGWQGPHADANRWLVSGHSNGGQGTLYALTHYPDKIIGAAPVSGYISIQKYIPYIMWNDAEARVTQIVQTSLQSFQHELLVENFTGIPVLQQHGSADDNVPAFHSRRFFQLMSQTGQMETRRYVELPGKGHWFEGAMTTPCLKEFYNQCVESETKKPALPRSFQIVVANPADMASRGGLQVDQLLTPDQLGRVNVTWDASKSVHCETSNIKRFHFDADGALVEGMTRLIIDGQKFLEFCMEQPGNKPTSWFILIDGSWKVSRDSQWVLSERHGRQLGPLFSILRTQGRLRIQCLATAGTEVALQLSRNLHQYYGADADLVEEADDVTSHLGNVVTVSVGAHKPPKHLAAHPIEVDRDGRLVLRVRDGTKRRYDVQEGLGTIFLRPLANDRLELVIWGYDEAGLRQAARLFPMLTGVGQADFVIVRKRMAWEGAAGALAMGLFDSQWQVSEASFVQ